MATLTPFLSEASNQASTSSRPAIVLFLKHDDDNVEYDDANNVIDNGNGSDDYHDVFSNGNLLQALTASFLVMDPLSSLSISLKIREISSSLILSMHCNVVEDHRHF